MARGPFDPDIGDLPQVLPIFPLAGVLLLPRGMLPLNIFEGRYLNMTADALKSDHRMIGMIQPTGADDAEQATAPGRTGPEVFKTGCAGRIVSFSETRDGRYAITLRGVARFHIAEELPLLDGYRRVRPDFSAFKADLDETYPRGRIDRDRLLAALEHYFTVHKIDPNWQAIRAMGDRMLVTSLAMGCPFNASEKQALLEADALPARASVLTTLLEMSGTTEGSDSTRH